MDWARLYLGGKGLLFRYLFEELAPGTAALAPSVRALVANRLHPDRVPVAHQYNKRDQHDAMPPEDLDDLFGVRAPAFLACAVSGYQVFATLDWVVGAILGRFHATLPAEARPRETAALAP